MRYLVPSGVRLHHGDPPFFTTPEGGVVVTDEGLAALWSAAHDATLTDLADAFARDPRVRDAVCEALACLAEAGLLARASPISRPQPDPVSNAGPPVSIVIVVSSARELEYLDDCLRSIAETRYDPCELLVVDNDAHANVAAFVRPRVGSNARIVTLTAQRCLAAASNAAIAQCEGKYILLMNPDVKLVPETVARLVARAETQPRAAAVVPKTRLWRTPAFLNAIGNRVPTTNWGTDNAIGQLDLGQFDDWRTPPSASLTIELVSRRAWDAVGPFDENFPAYYEDAEWAYRARLMGWTIAAEPAADALHIFGGFWDAAPDGALSHRKLKTAVIGRMQFACKIASAPTLRRLLWSYAAEDAGNLTQVLKRGDFGAGRAYAGAWLSVLGRSVTLASARRHIQAARVIEDRTLFPPESDMPLSHTHRNSPVLTSALVREYYATLLRRGRTRRVPEVALSS